MNNKTHAPNFVFVAFLQGLANRLCVLMQKKNYRYRFALIVKWMHLLHVRAKGYLLKTWRQQLLCIRRCFSVWASLHFQCGHSLGRWGINPAVWLLKMKNNKNVNLMSIQHYLDTHICLGRGIPSSWFNLPLCKFVMNTDVAVLSNCCFTDIVCPRSSVLSSSNALMTLSSFY